MRQLLLPLLCCLFSFSVDARVFPQEMATLTYVRIPFTVDKVPGAVYYTFKVAQGRSTDTSDIGDQVVAEQKATSPFAIVQLDRLGGKYTWQVICSDSLGRQISKSPVYHFRTITPELKDMSKFRVRVIKNNYKPGKKLHFFVDCLESLYDAEGNLVWSLNTFGREVKFSALSDLKPTPFNTLSFLSGESIYETDYMGNVLWSAVPQGRGSGVESYHHEFTRLKNGNYMALSSEVIKKKLPNSDSTLPVIFGTIVEYDAAGRKVWEWRSSEYFKDADIFDRRYGDGIINSRSVRTHLNAFYYDEQNGIVYAGFKDISRILKIGYADRKVLADINGKPKGAATLFSQQHSIGKDSDGYLCVFSNNDGKTPNELFTDSRPEDSVSMIARIREPKGAADKPEKVWEMSAGVDTAMPQLSGRGGNIVELPDGNLFVCTGASGGIFVVNKKKEVLYSAIAEMWNDSENKWVVFPQYRASPVFADELDKLIETSVHSLPAGEGPLRR